MEPTFLILFLFSSKLYYSNKVFCRKEIKLFLSNYKVVLTSENRKVSVIYTGMLTLVVMGLLN